MCFIPVHHPRKKHKTTHQICPIASICWWWASISLVQKKRFVFGFPDLCEPSSFLGMLSCRTNVKLSKKRGIPQISPNPSKSTGQSSLSYSHYTGRSGGPILICTHFLSSGTRAFGFSCNRCWRHIWKFTSSVTLKKTKKGDQRKNNRES